MLKLSIFLLLSVAVLSSQSTPIPSKPDGFPLGSNTPTFHLEAFYDLLCPDSKKSFDVVLTVLETNFNLPTNQTLRFTTHIFPNTFHRNSFMTAQGARIIADNLIQEDDLWNYFAYIFSFQDLLSNQKTMDYTQEEVKELLTYLTTQLLPGYSKIFADGLEYGNQYDSEARISWKYGCSRGVTGTPTYFANGVAINGAASFNADQWVNFINGGYVNNIYL